MTEREKISSRITEALKMAAPHSGHSQLKTAAPNPAASSPSFRDVLPKSGNTFEELLTLFRRVSTDLKAVFHLAQNKNEATVLIEQLQQEERWTRVALHHGVLIDAVLPESKLPRLYTDHPYNVRELEKCDVGISECDALIAQTGSILLTTRSAGGRALSVLPPHHLVVASADKLVADLPEAFALLRDKYAPAFPSFISLITGPSRTGDIERILVLGAHGPKKLTIILTMQS